MTFSKPVLEFWAKGYYPLVPAAAGGALGFAMTQGAKRKDKATAWAMGGLLLGIGVMLYSRKALGRSALGSLEDAPFQGGEFGGDSDLLQAAASKQIDNAAAGKRIKDYREVKLTNTVLGKPATVKDALNKSAFWLAVASQIEGSSLLLAEARAAYHSARAIFGTNPLGFAATSPQGMIDGALATAAGSVTAKSQSPSGRAVASIMGAPKGAGAWSPSMVAASGEAAKAAIAKLKEVWDTTVDVGEDAAGLIMPAWVMPVLVGGGVLAGGVLIYILASGGKSRAPAAAAA